MRNIKGALVIATAAILLVGGCSSSPGNAGPATVSFSQPTRSSILINTTTTSTPSSIPPLKTSVSLEYRFSGTAPSIFAAYTGADGESLQDLFRPPYTIAFDDFKNNFFAVVAGGGTGSIGTVEIQVYIDGVLMSVGTASGSDSAQASGRIR